MKALTQVTAPSPTRAEFLEQHEAAVNAQATAIAHQLAQADGVKDGIAHTAIESAIGFNAADFKLYFATMQKEYIVATGSDGSYVRQIKSLAGHAITLTGKARTAFLAKSVSAMKAARAQKRAPHQNDKTEDGATGKVGKKADEVKAEKAVPFDVVLYKAIEQASAHETMHLMGVFLQAARNNGLLDPALVKPMDALTKALEKLGANK